MRDNSVLPMATFIRLMKEGNESISAHRDISRWARTMGILLVVASAYFLGARHYTEAGTGFCIAELYFGLNLWSRSSMRSLQKTMAELIEVFTAREKILEIHEMYKGADPNIGN